MPLGEAYSGVCRARADEFHVPSETHLRDICNCGYARGVCDRFPSGDAEDAVRFSAAQPENGRLTLIYLFEKDHAPVRHGVLEFSIEQNAFIDAQADAQADAVLLRQARAFAEHFLKLL
jgi:hypothetical protein